MTRVGIENSRVFLPGFNNGLIRRFLSQGLEMFGKVKGIHKGQHMRPEAAQVRVVESLDGGFRASAFIRSACLKIASCEVMRRY